MIYSNYESKEMNSNLEHIAAGGHKLKACDLTTIICFSYTEIFITILIYSVG